MTTKNDRIAVHAQETRNMEKYNGLFINIAKWHQE